MRQSQKRREELGNVVGMKNAQLSELGRKTPKQVHVMDQASSPVTRRPYMRPSAWLRSASYIFSAPRVASKNYPVAPASAPPFPALPGRLCRSARACRPPRSGRAARPPSIGGAPHSLRCRSHPGAVGRRLLRRYCAGGRGSRRGGRRRELRAHHLLGSGSVSIAPCGGGKVAIYEHLVSKLEAIRVAGTGGSLRSGILTSVCHWGDIKISVNGYWL